MIPRLVALAPVHETYRALAAALWAVFEGDVHLDHATRLVAATDNSVYQILPQVVVYPRSMADIVALGRLLEEPRFQGVTLAPRGGGTGTNGQALSTGVILDVSRHMDRILGLDLEAGTVRVQPGVVLDQLNAFLRPHGVFFAPNVSPSSRATLGGMIMTDACGQGSRIYGRTSDHVVELVTVLCDGTVLTSRILDEAGLREATIREDVVGCIHRVVNDVVTAKAGSIAGLPRLRRFMTGYNLGRVRDVAAGTFDLNALLCGSEGTLGVVCEAVLKVTRIPPERRLVALRYASFDDALGSAEALLESDPCAIETIDETLLTLAREDVVWHTVAHILEDTDGGVPTRAFNLVEWVGSDGPALDARVGSLLASLPAHRGEPGWPIGGAEVADPDDARALWETRKKAVGLLGNAPGPRKPAAFVEDTVVPPERLRGYIEAFRGLLEEEGLSYAMYGHVDVGCLHVRPAIDTKDPADEERLRRISDRVARLVAEHGGLIWGEHGKGFRSEYNPVFFGPELYAELCRIKAAFDPEGRLNPGKIAVSPGSGHALATLDAPTRGSFDRHIPAPLRARFRTVIDCNGNAQCHDFDPDHVMCPSARVTRSRVHSPRGRAGVLREWLRQAAAAGADPEAELRSPPGALVRLAGALPRLFRTLRHRFGGDGCYDFSHEVREAMDGCLACKACATQCPVKVDVPELRAEFLTLYHGRYARPLRDHLIARLESAVAAMALLPRLSNALSTNPLSRWLLERVAGIVDTPRLSVPTARAELLRRGIRRFDAERVAAELDQETRPRTVAILPDAFTTFYEVPVLAAAVDLLLVLGWRVEVLPYHPSGKALHVRGFLHRFRRVAEKNAERLERVARLGIPIVGLDPAVVIVHRDEVPKALGRSPAYRVELLQEWLCRGLGDFRAISAASPEPYQLLGHCTERTAVPGADRMWVRVFEALGLRLCARQVGCCGMCGAYGHERRHVEESRGVFEASWQRAIPADEAGRRRVLATGHSCRSQVERFAGFLPMHPVQALVRELVLRQQNGPPIARV